MRHVLAVAFITLLLGCASQPEPASPSGQAPVNTSLSNLMSAKGGSPAPAPVTAPPTKPTPIARLAENQPDIQAILDKDPPAEPAPQVVVTETPTVEPAPVEPMPEATAPVEPPKTLAEQIDQTSLLLTDLLRQNTAVSESPFRAALALAAMEAVRPGSAPKVITPDSVDGGPLTDEQREVVNAFRDLVAGMTAAADSGPGELTDRSVELGNAFSRARPMRISAALAAKVTGYGQFVPLDARKLQQGKPTKAVVYTEVRRFAQRPVTEGDTAQGGGGGQPHDKFAVELSQELQLIHDADGVKAWQRAEQPVVETSRSYRSDFYLVQNITLPHTLSIGAYKLKVIVRDKIGGHVDEFIIPLEVVADPTLVQESGKGLYD
jgi:hypothetical protein